MISSISRVSELILPILLQYKIKQAGIFGSVARGEDTASSDIDILVDAPDTLSLIDMIKLQQELEDKLKKSVDLVEYRLLKEHIKERALHDEIRIL